REGVLRMSGGESRWQQFAISFSENANVDRARSHLARVRIIGIRVTDAKLLEPYRLRTEGSDGISHGFPLRIQFIHDARNEDALITSPVTNLVVRRKFGGSGDVDRERLAFLLATACSP